MIRLKYILLEKEEKSPSQDPNKILIKSKESGQSYYISKDNFDPSKHEKVEKKQKKKKDEVPTDSSMNTTSTEKSASSDKKDGEKSDSTPKDVKKEPKKLSAKEKLEKTNFFLFSVLLLFSRSI